MTDILSILVLVIVVLYSWYWWLKFGYDLGRRSGLRDGYQRGVNDIKTWVHELGKEVRRE